MNSPLKSTRYHIRTTREASCINAAQKLRYEVFNVELGEGLDSSHLAQRDVDPYDAHCEHLIIETEGEGGAEVVGTYRLQTGEMAAAGIGYYSAQEFDFTPYEPYRAELLELGRACIHRDHRKRAVLDLLWRGIADFARLHHIRYLIGCSSLTSQNPDEGWAAYKKLSPKFLTEAHLQTEPLAASRMPEPSGAEVASQVPKLFAAYLHIGARIAGTPALDRAFQTIDFLTILDFEAMEKRGKNHFLSRHG